MTMPDNLGNGSATQERFTGPYRKARREASLTIEAPAEREPERVVRQGLPSDLSAAGGKDLPSLEPVYPPQWVNGEPEALIADHPLLRGLLLELPPKGSIPTAGWLDRWFEAARSILELLYLQDANRPRG
ncbi:hypothetical protein O7635_10220 [Asanoa sp. WMMD1127]|uniref:hypothetical protein n=1 Tax=Asanoa sp. WMMD1127 TaxID=3016107 RepID=UPI00241617D1|nr:hypothetical protein [Asanoa sp. WMMD1127]MDG4822227.1 hypothetical protein [Asanoa sp. WMMD1127]